MDPNAQTGTGLSQQIGPLKLWQWGGVIIIGAVAFLWWRNRQAGGSSALDNSQGGTMYGDVNSGDYSSGYDNGYAAGLNASGTGTGSSSGGGTVPAEGNAQGPIAHDRFHATVKNPAGHKTTVVGYGTWIRKNGRWTWQVGIPRQFALVGNGTGTGASQTAQDVQAQMAQGATGAADGAPLQPAMATDGSAATLDQATGTAGAATAGGGGTASTPAPVSGGAATGRTISGQAGKSAPAQTATQAQRIAQLVKDLQNPGPNFTQQKQASYLATYKQLTGHAYTGKLGQLQVGQHVQYATV